MTSKKDPSGERPPSASRDQGSFGQVSSMVDSNLIVPATGRRCRKPYEAPRKGERGTRERGSEWAKRWPAVVLTHPRLDCPRSTRKTALGQRRGPGSNGAWAASTLARHVVIGKRNVLRQDSDNEGPSLSDLAIFALRGGMSSGDQEPPLFCSS